MKNYLFIVKDLTAEKDRTFSGMYSKEVLECTDMKDFIPTRKGTFKSREVDGTLEIILKF